MRRRIPALVAAVTMTLAACPHRFDPAAAPAVTSPDDSASQEYARALQLFERGDLPRSDAAMATFVQGHPDDPLAPAARLYRGRIALRLGQPKKARQILESVTAKLPPGDAVGSQARYYLGLAQVRLGAHAPGRQLLAPFLGHIADKDRPALLAALATAARHAGDPRAAARHLGELHRITDRPTEKRWARDQLEALLQTGATSRADLQAIHRAAPADSLAAALAGKALAAAETAAGNTAAAERILEATAAARRRHDVGDAASAVRSSVVGVLVPLGGRYRAAGQELLRGAVEASGALSGTGNHRLGLAVRDSSADAAAAARELIEDERVLALVGTLDPGAGGAAARVAGRAAVPFIALSRLSDAPAATLLPDNRDRARALAQHASAAGLKRVLVLAPDNSYGKAMARAFGAAAKVVDHVTYRPGATSFADVARRLARKYRFDGLFVPDTAHTLGLIAPALAREGLWSGKAPSSDRGARSFQLLATADGLGTHLLRSAGRYVHGAVLAPGFYPDDTAGGSGPLVRSFVQRQGKPPSLVAALGFDAVRVVRVLRQRGARGRAELRRSLSTSSTVQGMTGRIRFDSRGRRVDPPLLFRVEGDRIKKIEPAGSR